MTLSVSVRAEVTAARKNRGHEKLIGGGVVVEDFPGVRDENVSVTIRGYGWKRIKEMGSNWGKAFMVVENKIWI